MVKLLLLDQDLKAKMKKVKYKKKQAEASITKKGELQSARVNWLFEMFNL